MGADIHYLCPCCLLEDFTHLCDGFYICNESMEKFKRPVQEVIEYEEA